MNWVVINICMQLTLVIEFGLIENICSGRNYIYLCSRSLGRVLLTKQLNPPPGAAASFLVRCMYQGISISQGAPRVWNATKSTKVFLHDPVSSNGALLYRLMTLLSEATSLFSRRPAALWRGGLNVFRWIFKLLIPARNNTPDPQLITKR